MKRSAFEASYQCDHRGLVFRVPSGKRSPNISNVEHRRAKLGARSISVGEIRLSEELSAKLVDIVSSVVTADLWIKPLCRVMSSHNNFITKLCQFKKLVAAFAIKASAVEALERGS